MDPAVAKNADENTTTKDVTKYGYYVLHVKDLALTPRRTFVKMFQSFARRKLQGMESGLSLLPSLRKIDRNAHIDVPLYRINFSAKSGEVTVIMGDRNERHNLMKLLTGRKRAGQFDGDITMTGPGLRPDSYYYDHVAFVQTVRICLDVRLWWGS